MKKLFAAAIVVALGFVIFVTPALSWEKGTHLYIADKLKRQGGLMNPQNLDEMYGAMAPDIFNYVFEIPAGVYDYLYDETHHQFINIWKAVKWGYEKPLAFGFVSHNDSWGADYTAHHRARTTGLMEGYVITKAGYLNLGLAPYWEQIELLTGPLVETIKVDLCHNIVEAAGDIILKRSYPQLGRNLVAAGSRLDARFKKLFLKAYLPGLTAVMGAENAAQNLILLGEAAFRQYQVVAYGQILQQDEAIVIDQIAAQFNLLVGGYLLSKGITLPEGTDLTLVIVAALQGAIALCENDYMIEVNATVAYVKGQLKARRFWASTR